MPVLATMNRVCAQTTLRLPWLLNGSLAQDERREVREHLIGCPACRAELAQARQALAIFAEAASAPVVEASEPVQAHRATVVDLATRRRSAGRRTAPWAAAAAIAIAVLGSLFVPRGAEEPAVVAATPAQEPAPAAAQPQPLFHDGFDAGRLDGWETQL